MRRFLSFFALLGVVALLSSGCIISDYPAALVEGPGENLSHMAFDCDDFDRVGNLQQLAEKTALGDPPGDVVWGGNPDTQMLYCSGSPIALGLYGSPISRADARAMFRFQGAGLYESGEVATIGVGSNVAAAQLTPLGDPKNGGSTDGLMITGSLLPYEPGVTTFSCNSRYGFGRAAPAGGQVGHILGPDGVRRIGVPVYVAIDTRPGCQFADNIVAAVPGHWIGPTGHNGWAMTCYSGASFSSGMLAEAPLQRTLDVTPVFGESTEVTLGDLTATVIASLDEETGDITVHFQDLSIRGNTFVPSTNLDLTLAGGKAALAIDPTDPALHELARWALDNFNEEDWAPFYFNNELIPFTSQVVKTVGVKIDRDVVEHWVNFWGAGTEPTQRDRLR